MFGIGKNRKHKSSQLSKFKPSLEMLEIRDVPAILPGGESFEGLTRLESGGFPPDPHGAVGLQHLVSINNFNIEWFDRSNPLGTVQSSQTLRNFFAPLNPITSTFDPKVLFDEYAQRFVALTLEQTGRGGGTQSSRILLAVSDDANPNGNWNFMAINSLTNIGGVNTWFDYPGFAFDQQALYITGNMFGFGNEGFRDSRLWIVDKGSGTGGFYDTAGTGTFTAHDPLAGNGNGFTLQPANIRGGGQGVGIGTWLTAYNGLTNGVDEFIDFVQINNPLGATTFNTFQVNVGNIENTGIGFPNAPQLSGATPINTGDRRMLDAVWRNNRLYAVTTIIDGAGEESAHWFEFNTSGSVVNGPVVSLMQQGNANGEDIAAGTRTFWAAIDVNAANDIAIGYAASGPALNASAYFSTRLNGDSAGTLRQARVVAQGLDSYVLLDGSNRNRWGDYTAIRVDPNDPQRFWAFNEYALPSTTGNLWGTRWRSFLVGGPTSGAVVITANDDPGRDNIQNDFKDDIFELRFSATTVGLFINGAQFYAIPLNQISSIQINGSSDNDRTILDFGGNVPNAVIPVGGITFNGGAGNDAIEFRNGNNNSVNYFADGVGLDGNNGRVTFDGNRTVSYVGLEPILDTTTAFTRTFIITTAGAQDIQVRDDGIAGNGINRIDTNGTGGFEQIDFINPFTLLTVNGNNAVNSIFLRQNFDMSFAPLGITLNGLDGNDTFYAWLTPFTQITVNGELPVVGDPGVPPGDKLVIGTFGATVVPFNSPDGVVTAPGFNALSFTSIETMVLPDRFELNNTIATATFLGSPTTVTLDRLSIHSTDDPSTPNVNEADVDYFRYTAHDTGYLVINAIFAQAIGDLDISVRDQNDQVLAGSAGVVDNERLVIPVVSQQVYYIRVNGFNNATNNYHLELENFKVPVPTAVDLLASSDTGRSDSDNIISTVVNNVTTIQIQADLSNLPTGVNNGITVLDPTAVGVMQLTVPGFLVEVFNNGVSVGFAQAVPGTDNTLFTFTFNDPTFSLAPALLPEGGNKITSAIRVIDIHSPPVNGRDQLGSPPLFVTVDTVAPNQSNFGLYGADDTGIAGQPLTFVDQITKLASPRFAGFTDDPASWVRVWAANIVTGGLVDIGTSLTAGGQLNLPVNGQFIVSPSISLNSLAVANGSNDGERIITIENYDLAGNVSTATFTIFLDTAGPRVAGVTYRYVLNGNPQVIDLLNQTLDGNKVALPQINYIDVTLFDQPNRTNTFTYPAANELLATTPGNYGIVGKRTGNQTIQNVIVLQDDTVSGGPGQTTYRLFLSKPLADDRYTFKVFDRVKDQAGNALDGDFQPPILPSGDGVPGGNFVVQFLTIDSAAELGTYANGSANLDLNGDFIVNPGSTVGDDAIIPTAPNGAAVFSGQFFPAGASSVDGFDRLGTYGKQGKNYVFRTDFNNDGDFNDPGETTVQTSLKINGLPVAGNWGPQVINSVSGLFSGQSVGVFNGTTWYLDANGNNIIETAAAGDRVLKGNMKGLPFTGDFDGDGITDLGTYLNGVFYLDLSINDAGGLVTGFSNYTFRATLPLQTSGTASRLARPVAADFDGDGITDIGLFIPNQTTVPSGQANWFLMNSSGTPWDIAVPSGTVRGFKNAATGVGNDVAATYGSARALPVVGNFDPIIKAPQTPAAKAAAQAAAANLAHNLADLYFEGTDKTDFVFGKARRSR